MRPVVTAIRRVLSEVEIVVKPRSRATSRASMPETAAAEIRPRTGESACVADFTIREIRAVDLRNPRKLVSPFILEDSGARGQLRADLPLLERRQGLRRTRHAQARTPRSSEE